MKKILGLICLLAFSLFEAKADGTVNDYVYATGLQYDSEFDLYYFDVMLEGENLYTAYGMDIQLPAGMEVVEDEYGIFVEMIKDIYPSSGRNKEYTHSVTPAFPYPDDHSHLRVGCISTKNELMTATSGALFRVYVTSTYTSGWPVGSIKLYAAELAMVGSHHNPQDHETVVAIHTGSTVLPLNISASSHWSTCILPFSTELPTGVKAYTSSTSDEENIFLTPAASLAAYTPYVLYSEAGFSGTVTGTVAETGYPETGYVTAGNLNGAVVPQTVKNGYIMQKQNGEVMFYAIGSGDSFLVPAGKCWMQIPAGGSAKAYNFIVADETGVERLIAPVDNGGKVYDLTGRHVTQLRQNTLYIKDGKKFINK